LEQAIRAQEQTCVAALSPEEYARLGQTIDCPITAMPQFVGRPKGRYFVNIPFIPQGQLVFDVGAPGEVWIRLNHKIDRSLYGTTGTRWTEDAVAAILPHVKAFGVSDDPTTMHTEYSWYIEEPEITAGRTLAYLSMDQSVSVVSYLTNVLNGLTPTGTSWSCRYTSAYVWFRGLFKTFGGWTSMYMYQGSQGRVYVAVGTRTSIRTGGHLKHPGEYIHSTCLGYHWRDHSITALVLWHNSRFFWFRIE
jgi:hypothetical protein